MLTAVSSFTDIWLPQPPDMHTHNTHSPPVHLNSTAAHFFPSSVLPDKIKSLLSRYSFSPIFFLPLGVKVHYCFILLHPLEFLLRHVFSVNEVPVIVLERKIRHTPCFCKSCGGKNRTHKQIIKRQFQKHIINSAHGLPCKHLGEND